MKRSNVFENLISNFFLAKILFKKDDVCNKRTLCKILAF
jgi:hypothetical protein